MQNKNKVLPILAGVGIALVTLVLLIPFFYTAIMSVTDYSIRQGLFGSDIIGLTNYEIFITGPYFPRLLLNTLIISILGTIVGVIYVYIASLAIGSIKNPFLKAFLAILFVTPALIPTNCFVNLFYMAPLSFQMNASYLLNVVVAVIDGLRFAGLVVFAAFFIKGNVFKESLKCALLFLAIRLIYIFSSNIDLITSIYQPVTYETLDVLSTYAYRLGLGSTSGRPDFSMSAAIHVTKVILQFIPAVIACVILIFINKEKKADTPLSEKRFWPAALTAPIPAIVFLVMLVVNASMLPEMDTDTIVSGYLFEFIYAFLSALLVTVVAYVLALGARYSRFAGCIALTLLALTANSMMGPFLMIKNCELINTVLGPVFMNMSMVPILALIFTFILYRENSIKSNITAFILGFGMMFATFWGNILSTAITATEDSRISLSVLLRSVIRTANEREDLVEEAGIYIKQWHYIPLSTVPYILIPAIAVAVGFLIAAIVYIIKFKKKA